MGAIRTVKIDNAQKYLLTDNLDADNGHHIQILTRPTASSTLTEGAIVGRQHQFYLDFSINPPQSESIPTTASVTLAFQPIRDYICQVVIAATLYGGKQPYGTFSVKIGEQTLLIADAHSYVDNTFVWGAGLSLYFYIGKDHKLRALAQQTYLKTGMYGDITGVGNGTYTTAQLEAGAGTELGVSAPTAVRRSPWGGDFDQNYYRQSYYDGDTIGGLSAWETPWQVSTIGALHMTAGLQGSNTWRVPYNTYTG